MPKYDVAVMGAGLGGLAAAALLSNKNKKVMLIEQGPSLRDAWGTVEKDGFLFSIGPALSYGFEQGGALRELSTMLGIEQNVSIRPLCYQVALPDHRINVYAEPEATQEELRREFRSETNAFVQFYQDLAILANKMAKNRIMAYLLDLHSAGRFMRSYGFSNELTTFFDVQALYFFQKPVADLSVAKLITLCRTPPLHLDGGFNKLSDQLCQAILQHGGEVRYNEPSSTLSFRNHNAVGIETSHGMVEADTILLNSLPRRHKSLLFLGLLEEVIPTCMSTDVLFVPEYAHAREFTALSFGTSTHDTIALAGTKALTASFASQGDLTDKQDKIELLSVLIPFLTDFMFFAEEYKPHAGHAVLPGDTVIRSSQKTSLGSVIGRTSHKNVYVLHDTPDAPLQAVVAAQRFHAKLN